MTDDRKLFQPWEVCFKMFILHKVVYSSEAHSLERAEIAAHEARGVKGYNILKGVPFRDGKFWATNEGKKLMNRQ